MTKHYLFSDEAGDMEFTRKQNVSRYFLICTVSTSGLDVVRGLDDLRRELIREGAEVSDCFHATSDSQIVRDRVFAELLKHDFHVQATICEKSKAQPQVRVSKHRFFKTPWYFHVKFGLAKHVPKGTHLYVTAASIGTKKERQTYLTNLQDVARQSIANATYSVDFRPSMADAGLQVADYCAWAIQRKWERGDRRSYDLVAPRITYEYELWKSGAHHYY